MGLVIGPRRRRGRPAKPQQWRCECGATLQLDPLHWAQQIALHVRYCHGGRDGQQGKAGEGSGHSE